MLVTLWLTLFRRGSPAESQAAPLMSARHGPLSFSFFSEFLLSGTTACPRRISDFLCSSCSMNEPPRGVGSERGIAHVARGRPCCQGLGGRSQGARGRFNPHACTFCTSAQTGHLRGERINARAACRPQGFARPPPPCW